MCRPPGEPFSRGSPVGALGESTSWGGTVCWGIALPFRLLIRRRANGGDPVICGESREREEYQERGFLRKEEVGRKEKERPKKRGVKANPIRLRGKHRKICNAVH